MFSHHNVAIEAVELRKEQAMPVRRDTQSELGRLVECCYILGRVMREIDEANNRLRQRTRCGHVVNTVSRYCKVEPIHGIRDLGFLASAAGHFPKACRRALATDIENRFPVGRNQREIDFLYPWPRLCGKRSEEHTSELQSHVNLVCRLLLEKKN